MVAAPPSQPPPLVVDVGANAAQGFPAWRAAFPGATIVAVEANSALAARLGGMPPAGGHTHVVAHAVGAVAAAAGGGMGEVGGGTAVFRMPTDGGDGQGGGLWVGETRPEPQKYQYMVGCKGLVKVRAWGGGGGSCWGWARRVESTAWPADGRRATYWLTTLGGERGMR